MWEGRQVEGETVGRETGRGLELRHTKGARGTRSEIEQQQENVSQPSGEASWSRPLSGKDDRIGASNECGNAGVWTLTNHFMASIGSGGSKWDGAHEGNRTWFVPGWWAQKCVAGTNEIAIWSCLVSGWICLAERKDSSADHD